MLQLYTPVDPRQRHKIKYIGLKKGEKLYEKLYSDNEEKITQDKDGYFLVKSKKNHTSNIGDMIISLESFVIVIKIIYSKLFKILE